MGSVWGQENPFKNFLNKILEMLQYKDTATMED